MLANDSMKPVKLKSHMATKHTGFKNKMITLQLCIFYISDFRRRQATEGFGLPRTFICGKALLQRIFQLGFNENGGIPRKTIPVLQVLLVCTKLDGYDETNNSILHVLLSLYSTEIRDQQHPFLCYVQFTLLI
jgi:hypothetical protein